MSIVETRRVTGYPRQPDFKFKFRKAGQMKGTKGFVVVSIVLVLLMAMIVPASAAPSMGPGTCGWPVAFDEAAIPQQGYSWILIYGTHAASIHGVAYQHGVAKAFHGDLVAPASGYNALATGISGVEVRLGSDHNFYIVNASSQYTAEAYIVGVAMLFEGRCGHAY
jgi:hypothetical protein